MAVHNDNQSKTNPEAEKPVLLPRGNNPVFADHLHMHGTIANPFDRVAAFVVDHFIILAPILVTILAPMKSHLTETVYLDRPLEAIQQVAIMGAIAVVAIFLYRTLFTYFWGATPGKKLFSLKVVHVHPDKQLTFFNCAFRSIFWMIGGLFFFLPHLTIFNHYLRRPFYDLMARTLVINAKGEFFHPHPMELSFARGMYTSMIMLIAMIVGVPSWQVGKAYLKKSNTVASDETSTQVCEEVTEAMTSWNTLKGVQAERLHVAMTLFAGDEIDADCLEAEADQAFNSKMKKSTIFFAKSLIHANEPEISDLYLDQVCQDDRSSNVCLLSGVIDNPSKDKWDDFKNKLLVADASQSYLKVWAIRHSVRKHDFSMSFKLTEQLDGYPKLKTFFDEVKAKSLWGLHKYDESVASTKLALDEMDEPSKPQLAAWMCQQQVARSCQYASGLACTTLGAMVSKESRWLLDPGVAIAHLNAAECSQGSEIDYNPLIRMNLLSEARTLMMAEKRLQDGQVRQYQNMLFEMLRSASLSDAFEQEVMFRLSKNLQDRPELQKLVYKLWDATEHSLPWNRIGYQLIKNYRSTGAFELASKIGEKVMVYTPMLPEELRQDLVVANYHAGKPTRAREILKMPKDQPVPGRSVASTSEYEKIRAYLLGRGRRVGQ